MKTGFECNYDAIQKPISSGVLAGNTDQWEANGAQKQAVKLADALLELFEELKDFDLCLYTGHEIEEVPEEIIKYLKYIKVGRFILKERTSTTPFVGSKNQKFVRIHHEETK